MSKNQDRIVELQRQVKIAKAVLTKIALGCRAPELEASAALDCMWSNDKKQALQYLVGHENRGHR
jgi:hypothetical protein